MKPAYGERAIDPRAADEGFVLLASREGRDESIQIHQDVDLWLARPPAGARRTLPLKPERHAWVHVAQGAVTLNGQPMREGDGAAVSGEGSLTLADGDEAEVLVFDLA